MDLGSAQDGTLKSARELAAIWRDSTAAEIDPIKQRETDRREGLRNRHLFKDIAGDAFERRKVELKGDGELGTTVGLVKLLFYGVFLCQIVPVRRDRIGSSRYGQR